MVSSARNPRRRFSIAKCQAIYLQMLPAIQRHAAHLLQESEARGPTGGRAKRALQHLGGLGWAGKTRQARSGLRDHFGRLRRQQTRDHRIVGGHLDIKDVLSPYCQAKKNVKVERIDHFDEEENQWQEAVVEDTRTATVPDIVAFRCDFADWLKSLRRRDRRIAESLALGNRTTDVARRFKVCAGRVSQLRRELAKSWKEFVGDEPGARGCVVDNPSDVPILVGIVAGQDGLSLIFVS